MSRAKFELFALLVVSSALLWACESRTVTSDAGPGGGEGEGEGEGESDGGGEGEGEPGCIPLADQDTTCDEVDDDCDGATDEDYVPDDTCGVGFCRIGNMPSRCDRGRVSACQPGPPSSPWDRSCDGVDDDCDGEADEDYASRNVCGLGVCERPRRCEDGREVCTPGQSEEEVCDGEDNDCDGATDEEQVCGDCVGVTTNTVLSAGPWGACAGFEDDCDEHGVETRILRVCRAEEEVTRQEERACPRETDGEPCGQGGRCANGVCGSGQPCPDEGDHLEDAMPIRIEGDGRWTEALCLADNADDRFRITLPPQSQAHLRLVLDPGVQDQVRIWLYDNSAFAEPALQGGEQGLLELQAANPSDEEERQYVLIYNSTRSQDVGYILEARY